VAVGDYSGITRNYMVIIPLIIDKMPYRVHRWIYGGQVHYV